MESLLSLHSLRAAISKSAQKFTICTPTAKWTMGGVGGGQLCTHPLCFEGEVSFPLVRIIFWKQKKQLLFRHFLGVHLVPGTSSSYSSTLYSSFPNRKMYNESFLADLMNQYLIETFMLPLHPLMDSLAKIMAVSSLLQFLSSLSSNHIFYWLPHT